MTPNFNGLFSCFPGSSENGKRSGAAPPGQLCRHSAGWPPAAMPTRRVADGERMNLPEGVRVRASGTHPSLSNGSPGHVGGQARGPETSSRRTQPMGTTRG